MSSISEPRAGVIPSGTEGSVGIKANDSKEKPSEPSIYINSICILYSIWETRKLAIFTFLGNVINPRFDGSTRFTFGSKMGVFG